jgi:hypothetical protein
VEITAALTDDECALRISNLLAEVTTIFQAVVKSALHWPVELRIALMIIREVTASKFSESGDCSRISVGGFFFLRFLCPSIILPDKVGIFNKGKAYTTARPKLLLITKVLQNLANGTLFMDARMTPLNDWLLEHAHVMEELCLSLSSPDTDERDHLRFGDESSSGHGHGRARAHSNAHRDLLPIPLNRERSFEKKANVVINKTPPRVISKRSTSRRPSVTSRLSKDGKRVVSANNPIGTNPNPNSLASEGEAKAVDAALTRLHIFLRDSKNAISDGMTR